MSLLVGALVGSALASAGTGIYNAISSSKQNKISNDFAERNARLQEDVAYNGLGARISDAERNGISKWSVVGDSATAGQISNNTEPSHADKLDAIMDMLQIKQMEVATDKLQAEKDNLDYQRNYADTHCLPIGIQPGLEQSLLGWLDTPDNRKFIEDSVGNLIGKGKSAVEKIENFDPKQIEKNFKKSVPLTPEWKRDRYEHKERNGGEKYAKEQSYKDRSGNKARDRRLRAQSRDQGALPPGSIPSYIYRR